jgi:hypothetical protein
MIILTLGFLAVMFPIGAVIAVWACRIPKPVPDADDLLRKMVGE